MTFVFKYFEFLFDDNDYYLSHGAPVSEFKVVLKSGSSPIVNFILMGFCVMVSLITQAIK